MMMMIIIITFLHYMELVTFLLLVIYSEKLFLCGCGLWL